VRRSLSRLAALILSIVFSMPSVVCADNRVNWYGQANPISTNLNLEQRDRRIGEGTFQWNAMGSGSSYSGTFANLSIAPSGSLNVAVGPINTSFPGSLYGIGPDDTAAYPATQPSGATGLSLPADSTQLLLEAVTTTATGSIGTTAGTSSGQSIDNLIECKPLTADATTQTINLITSSGGSAGTATVNRDRNDTISCQNKASASSTTPIVPSVDAGYVAMGYVNVPYGTSSITSGLVTNYAPFPGFALASTPGATGVDTSSTPQTKIGSFTDNGNLNAGGNLNFGNGTTGGSFVGSTGNGNVTGNFSFGSGGTGGTFYGSTGNINFTGTSTAGQGYVSFASDGSSQLLFPSNVGANETAVGQNSGAGYPYFSVAKMTSVGAFQTWLLGIDGSNNLVVPSGNIVTPNNVIFGSSTLYGSTGNMNAAGNIVAGGSITGASTGFFTGQLTAGSAVISNLTSAGVVANNASGALSSIAPGATGNVLSSNGTAWLSSSSINIPGAIQGTNITATGSISGGSTGFFTGQLTAGSAQIAGSETIGANLNVTGSITSTSTGFFSGNVAAGSASISGSESVGGALTTGGNISSTGGSLSVPGNVTSTGGYLSSSVGANAGGTYYGSSGGPRLDYGVTAAGKWTLNNLGAGVLTTNSSGTISALGPALTHSSATNGYSVLPGGIIMEWGQVGPYASESGQGVTFPLTFPTGFLNAGATLYMANTSNPAGVDQDCQIQNPSSSGMTVYMQQNGGGSYTWNQYCYWTAVGY
jgi:fibronectin-binding autotransporter adhesin